VQCGLNAWVGPAPGPSFVLRSALPAIAEQGPLQEREPLQDDEEQEPLQPMIRKPQ